jgi:hypothetical protein
MSGSPCSAGAHACMGVPMSMVLLPAGWPVGRHADMSWLAGNSWFRRDRVLTRGHAHGARCMKRNPCLFSAHSGVCCLDRLHTVPLRHEERVLSELGPVGAVSVVEWFEPRLFGVLGGLFVC